MFRYVITETIQFEQRVGRVRVRAPAGCGMRPGHMAAKVHFNSGHHVVPQADITSKT